ncbi:MAG: ABC transporter ATP-binding protein/permease [Azospirillaceae bacterium]|nr:ABC transporter ATP-binding protein/permease [Azospirillaceae bacterium]
MVPLKTLSDLAQALRAFTRLAGGYWVSDKNSTPRWLALALVALTLCQVTVPILINLWSKRLFDALEQHSMNHLLAMIGAVGVIIAFSVTTTALHLRIKRRLQLGWRRWLTKKLLDRWLSRARHYQIAFAPGEHDNPDGRIAEDVRIATEAAIDLTLSLTYCVLLLIGFTKILWTLSGAPLVTIAGLSIHVPGYLLYLALVYAGIATTIAHKLGRPLVSVANRRQGNEQDFRFGLVQVREHAQAIALMHGETTERHRLTSLFAGVRDGWNGQTHALSNMMMFSATYAVLSAAVPFLVAAPRYIIGAITLGVLMQTAQAFQQAVGALSWPIDNLPRGAEWKASVERVLSLETALRRLTDEIRGHGIVVNSATQYRSLVFDKVAIADAVGTLLIEPFSIEIRPGERVLVDGEPRAAVRLFRAVARAWPWGQGTIGLPSHTRVFFVPDRPFLPRATLRGVLSYPADPETVGSGIAQSALSRVGLDYLYPELDETLNWDEILNAAEQQRLSFARILVRRPDWIFLEHATDSLDAGTQAAMLRLIIDQLPRATLMTIGGHDGLEAFHHRKLVLQRNAGITRLREEPIDRAAAQ